MSQSITKLFIANRGEICRRIASTAQRMGIKTAAICGSRTPPTYLAPYIDQFVVVDEESTALYLNQASMIQMAKDAGANALHPGFGFLSENDEFATAVQAAGLIWVGPSPKSITSMASKALARDVADRANVPCVRGIKDFPIPADEKCDFSAVTQFAKEVGLPLLIKAVKGGGGKGMRIVRQMEELKDAVLRAHSEAKSSFGDGSLICEQYLETPRHVEIQILADQHGNVTTVGDRDCSVQRRHQKIIEEAPAPNISDDTRLAMHTAAINLAKDVGYDSAGTVEFLLDWSPEAQKQSNQPFYFLEMNTRLQVEHPVSEEAFGIDLVEWQLRVAQKEKLPESMHHLKPHAHSIEVRIYAENVLENFFPAPGPVGSFERAEGPGIRWEIGLDQVDEISGQFDPMIAKLIATGADRPTALARLSQALRQSFFAGPPSNISLLDHICSASRFKDQPVSTAFLNTDLQNLIEGMESQGAKHSAAAEEVMDLLKSGQLFGKKILHSVPSPKELTAQIFAREGSSPGSDSSKWTSLSQKQITGGQGLTGFSGLVRKALPNDDQGTFWYAGITTMNGRHYWVGCQGFSWHQEIKSSGLAAGGPADQNSEEVLAPVPGKVTQCKVSEGTQVESGDPLLILESMKMEFEVKAPKSGTIAKFLVKPGDQVKAGEKLADWLQEE
jgi:acetyl/propionyl-CoA carboxylase alpha subunit